MIRKTVSVLLVLAFSTIALHAQTLVPGQSYLNSTAYAEYIYGTLPIIISAPHGGRSKPAAILNRTAACGEDIVTVLDTNTQELARALDSALAALTGQHPHTVICLLSRQKLDMNRGLAEAACGNATAEQTWYDYHTFIDSAAQRILRQHGRGLFIDLHGHGHDVQRNEIGYLLTGADLRLSDTIIDKGDYTAISSIRYLAWHNTGTQTHAGLLRGANAFGTLLAAAGYPSVPSQQDPYPLSGQSYFNGGYNTQRWGSRNGGRIDAFQIETNYEGVRDNTADIKRFADSLAKVITTYMQLNFAAADTPGALSATPLTAGRLLVGRFATANTALQKITLLEIDTASHAVTQSIDLPAAGPDAITLTNVVTDGQLTLSGNGQYVTMGGYYLDSGVTTSITNSGVNRVAGRLDAGTGFSTFKLPNASASSEYGDPYNTSNIRNAYTTDGNRFYIAGGSVSSTTNTTTGVWSFAAGATREAAQVTPVPNARWVYSLGNRLYMGCQSVAGTSQGIYRLGNTTLPVSAADTTRLFTPNNSSVVSFAFTPDSSTCYVCINSSSTHIEKWQLSGGNWMYLYSINPAGITTAPRAMTLGTTATAAAIFITYATQVVQLTDTISNTSAAAVNTTATVMYTETAAGMALRGICFTPATGSSLRIAKEQLAVKKEVGQNTTSAEALKVFPNPSETTVTVYHGKAGRNASLYLVAMNGNIVYHVQVAEGASRTSFSVAAYRKGTYVVNYYNNQVKTSCKLIR